MTQQQRGPDPLDIITAVVVATFGAAAVATSKGHGVAAISTITALFAAAWVTAPRRTFPTAETVCPNVTKQIVLVTGATSGIGVDTAGVLYQNGAKVYIAARNTIKLESTKEFIMAKYDSKTKGKIYTLVCDLSDLDSVKLCAETFLKCESKLNILINNAGIMALPERESTKQGLESQVGVCHVAHFLLTKLLLPAITNANGRVVCLSSVAHRRHQMKELLSSTPPLETVPYNSWVAYGNAKCCNMLMARGLQKRGVVAFSVMPGGIHTGLQAHVDPWTMFKWTIVTPFFFKSTSQGAATSIVCATSPDIIGHNGMYFDNCKVTDALSKVEIEAGADAADRLWVLTESVLSKLGY